MNIKVLTVLMAGLIMVACTSSDETDYSANNKTEAVTATGKSVSNQNKTNVDGIVGQQWQLVKLEGQTIEMADNQERAMYFELQKDNNRVTGFAGCNTFNGTYVLEEGMRIRFTQLLSTLKACPDVDADEQALLDVFELTDNYTLQNGQLSLNVGRRAPLAVFEKR